MRVFVKQTPHLRGELGVAIQREKHREGQLAGVLVPVRLQGGGRAQ